ncbi:MAG: DUF1353 domain-containing protein [Tannerellaceae bacterium]|nr:DUF1353 domain-containing protein [Tannerellaceae bacterium]
MIWYKDDELIIEFDKEPNVTMSYPMPCYDECKNREIDKKPFLNREDLHVRITYIDEKYCFLIPQGYTWDGATIPRFFWRFIGSNTSPEFLIPSMIHDVLCENHSYIDNDRYLSTLILERLLYCSGVNGFKRWMMKHSVDNFQKFKGWEK